MPLHIVCAHEESAIEVVRYLLELNPHAVHEKTAKGSSALELVEKGRAPLEVMLSVSAVALMLNHQRPLKRETVVSMVARLESMEWRGGILLFLDLNPSIIHKLNLHHELVLVPHLLSSFGKHCKLNTIYEMVKDMPGTFQEAQAAKEGVSKQ